MKQSKPESNFTLEEIKALENIADLDKLKIEAFSLISKPSQRPMKPAKVAWFRETLIRKTKHEQVIKLMWDLYLAGSQENLSVIGSGHSTEPNNYRKIFA